MSKVVVGMYEDIQQARRVVEDLVQHGFRREDISLVASDEKGHYRQYMGKSGGQGEDVKEGAMGGAGIGAVLGGLGGLLVGLGLLAIPGFGPILAAGPIATTLAGAGVGAVTGGIVGALVDLGIPEDKAKMYEQGVRHGNTLVTVNTTDNQVDQAVGILNKYHPVDVERRMPEWSGPSSMATEQRMPASSTTPRTDIHDEDIRDIKQGEGEVTLPVMEEELRVGKREVESGGVRVHTRMEEKPVDETVNLREEHVNVERQPVDRPADPADLDTFREGTMEVPETREEAVADKRARVVEEVTVNKDVQERPQTIHDTVRRTDVEVEDLGGRTTHSGAFDDDEDYFRDHFKSTYGNTSYTYDQYRPYYEYGYDLADRYQDRPWDDVEQAARRDWERTNPNSPWDQVREAVYQGWERAHGNQ